MKYLTIFFENILICKINHESSSVDRDLMKYLTIFFKKNIDDNKPTLCLRRKYKTRKK